MAKQKQLKLPPDRQYLQDKLAEGKAQYQDVSLKSLVSDPEHFQGRVKHLDMEWCREMAETVDRGGDLAPITVFDIKEKGLCYTTDGFHRDYVYRKAGRRTIPALVVEGTWQEAVRFAAMANTSERGLKRTMEDKRKQAEMLFADDECWEWSDNLIATWCGISNGGVVRRWKADYSQRTGKKIPNRVITANGTECPSSKPKGARSVVNAGHERHGAQIGKNRKYFRTKEEAISAIDESMAASREKHYLLHSTKELVRYFVYRFLPFRSFGSGKREMAGLWGGCGPSCVVTGHSRVRDFPGTDTIPAAVGRVLMLREMAGDPTLRCVVLLYPESHLPKLMELGQKLGVEFMTPDELADDLTAKGFAVKAETASA